MRSDTAPTDTTLAAIPPLDHADDHVRGQPDGPLIVEYGDYECPYSRAAYRQIQRLERATRGGVRFAFRHFPLTEIHPHALDAAAAAEAAARQERFWEMSELLFRGQHALSDEDLRRYAAELDLDLARFEADRTGEAVLARIRRDVDGALASQQVRGTPTLFVDGALHEGAYDAPTLHEALRRAERSTR